MSKYPSIKTRTYANTKAKWYDIIFGADSKEGRTFDIWLLWAILLSVLAIMAESVPSIDKLYGDELRWIEYGFTFLFTVEYAIRVWVSPNPKRFIFSFWGIIDLISTIPTYLAFFFPGPQVFRILRIFRLIRVFRVFRLTSFLLEGRGLVRSLKKSSAKIIVFFMVVLIVVVVMGTIMYLIEPPEAGFTSIPRSIYWAIVTITTVGYGDIAPTTTLGQFLSAILMIIGYAVIAVPTGIVSVEMSKKKIVKICKTCDNSDNDPNAKYCKICGELLT